MGWCDIATDAKNTRILVYVYSFPDNKTIASRGGQVWIADGNNEEGTSSTIKVSDGICQIGDRSFELFELSLGQPAINQK
jgi:hypothetical protein